MDTNGRRAIDEWPPLFDDALLAGAGMGRLLPHRHVIEIERESFRNPKTEGKRAA